MLSLSIVLFLTLVISKVWATAVDVEWNVGEPLEIIYSNNKIVIMV